MLIEFIELFDVQHILIQRPRNLVCVVQLWAYDDLLAGALGNEPCLVRLEESIERIDHAFHGRHLIIRYHLLHAGRDACVYWTWADTI